MGKKNLYYFVARDKKTNKFKFLDFDKSLEKIDLYTINYDNKDDLLKHLLDEGKINDIDTDIYIVTSKKNEGISYYDILYSDSSNIKDIAEGFSKKDIPTNLVDNVLDNFSFNMRYSDSLYNMVIDGKTCIYPKFVNYFKETSVDKFSQIKYKDSGWARKSYLLIRNIYDAFSKFHNSDVYDMSSDSTIGRKLIEDKLIKRIADNSDQMSLIDFDVFRDENDISKEKEENADKLLEITNTFDSIDRRIFKYVDRKVVLDTTKFNNISGEDLEQLKNLLDQKLMHTLYSYYNHKNFVFPDKREENSDYDTLIKQDQNSIIELLKNKIIFDNAYSWIMIYNKYILGEEYGRQKIKGE